jgi:transposase
MPLFNKLSVPERERLSVINDLLQTKMTNGQAAVKLKLSLRQVKRLKKKVREQGESAVIHQLKGKNGNHHLPPEVKEQVLFTVKEKYTDFKPKFAAEKLAEYEGIFVNPQTLRRWLVKEGSWKVNSQKQPQYHAWRERREYYGQLQQFDGSYHFWFETRLANSSGNPVEVCLLASIDDATGKITHAKFEFNEGVVAVFHFWKEYVEVLGKPLKIYLDKFSTYKINHKAAVDNFELLTQFQKVMKVLDIELISANSPQAKGRIERLFQTLQDRLVKELRLQKISTVDEGNKFLKEVFLPGFNRRFSVKPEKTGDVHRQLTKTEVQASNSIFSIKHTRRINHDFTIQFKNHFYQLEEIQPVTVRPEEKVMVEQWLDGTLHFKLKEKYLKYFVLPEKPKKVVSQPVILTTHPLNWKPPLNHPWRQYKQKLVNSQG